MEHDESSGGSLLVLNEDWLCLRRGKKRVQNDAQEQSNIAKRPRPSDQKEQHQHEMPPQLIHLQQQDQGRKRGMVEEQDAVERDRVDQATPLQGQVRMVEVMRENEGNQELERACLTLVCANVNRKVIVDGDTLAFVLGAMDRYKGDIQIQSKGCKVLASAAQMTEHRAWFETTRAYERLLGAAKVAGSTTDVEEMLDDIRHALQHLCTDRQSHALPAMLSAMIRDSYAFGLHLVGSQVLTTVAQSKHGRQRLFKLQAPKRLLYLLLNQPCLPHGLSRRIKTEIRGTFLAFAVEPEGAQFVMRLFAQAMEKCQFHDKLFLELFLELATVPPPV